MYRKRLAAVVACLAVGAAVFVAGMAPAFTEAPDRVPRIMMVFRSATPLNWKDEDKLAMIVTHPVVVEVISKVVPITGDAVRNTLLHNLPARSASEIDALAAMLTAAFQGSFSQVQVILVGKAGVERPYVYFDNQTPLPNGTMAQAGPEGDILVLGTFYFRQKTSSDEAWPYFLVDVPNNTWLVLDPAMAATATATGQLAIGWFNK